MAVDFNERMQAAEAAAAAKTMREAIGAEEILTRRRENLMRRYGPRIEEDTQALRTDLDLWTNPDRAEEFRERQARRMADTKTLGWDSFAVPDPRPTRFAEDIYKAQVEAGKTKLPRSRRRRFLQALAAPILSRYGMDFVSRQMVDLNHAMALGGGVEQPPTVPAGEKPEAAPTPSVPAPRVDASGYVYELIAAAAPDELTPEEAMEKYVALAHADLDNPGRTYSEDTADYAFDLLVGAGKRQDTPEERGAFLAEVKAKKQSAKGQAASANYETWAGGLQGDVGYIADPTTGERRLREPSEFADPTMQAVAGMIASGLAKDGPQAMLRYQQMEGRTAVEERFKESIARGDRRQMESDRRWFFGKASEARNNGDIEGQSYFEGLARDLDDEIRRLGRERPDGKPEPAPGLDGLPPLGGDTWNPSGEPPRWGGTGEETPPMPPPSPAAAAKARRAVEGPKSEKNPKPTAQDIFDEVTRKDSKLAVMGPRGIATFFMSHNATQATIASGLKSAGVPFAWLQWTYRDMEKRPDWYKKRGYTSDEKGARRKWADDVAWALNNVVYGRGKPKTKSAPAPVRLYRGGK